MKSETSFPKNKIRVLLLENIDKQARLAFEEEGYPVEEVPKSLSEDELAKKVHDVFLLGIRSKTQVTPRVLANAKRLIALGAFCIGTDQIDLPEASKAGVAVFNAPYSNTRSVVELALGEIIMLLRGTFDKSQKLHQGIWDKSTSGSVEVRGKTLGIIGYGNIGSQLSVLAENLGMQVCFYNTSEKLALGNAKKCLSMTEVLSRSDVVTVHVDGKPANRNLIAAREFEQMRDGVVFLNLSRGFVVDTEALAHYVRAGKVGGAAVDVFQQEPENNDQPFVTPLQGLPNVILTPHVGGSTQEAQRDIARFVSNRLISFVNTGDTTLSVNLPNVQLPHQRDCHRLLHLHRNVPGVMAQINRAFADAGINILGQFLKTNEQVGYVITDIDRSYDQTVLKRLRSIRETTRFRVLY